jgi:lipopolysaccharide transport system ATP-binding protein
MIVIAADHLSKCYRLGAIGGRTLRDDAQRWWARLRGHEPPIAPQDGPVSSKDEDIWALRDVSFEVERGEILGVIGRNGAGKSTLLKILSRITAPTAGQVKVRGRVASLLEVGTGFHPELTGRENVFLNGAILGMSTREIQRRLEDIIAFAELERFLDTPVKRYSSGMYVRLAFAVAAHLEPDILIVDEVLAVGDGQFQRKCLGKIEDVGRKGRTVIFVSHNMAMVERLCARAFLLADGRLAAQGSTVQVVHQYLQANAADAVSFRLADRTDRRGNASLRFVAVSLHDDSGKGLQVLQTGRPCCIRLHALASSTLRNVLAAVGLDDHMGQRIANFSNEVSAGVFDIILPGRHYIDITIPKLPLVPGRYGFTLFSSVNGVISDWVERAGFLDVEGGDFYGTGRIPSQSQGSILLEYRFAIKELPTTHQELL